MSNCPLPGNIPYINNYHNQEHNEFKKRSVLIIDDDYVNYLYFKELLFNITQNISRATSLHQALHLLVNNNFCLIFISASLPENFNNFALRYIKARFHAMPVISLIDDHYRYSEEDLLKAGSDICISRHTDPEHFIEAFFEAYESSEYV